MGTYQAPSAYRKKFGNTCTGGVSGALDAPVTLACPLSAGAIVAIVLCSLFAVAVVAFIVYYRKVVVPRRAAQRAEPATGSVDVDTNAAEIEFGTAALPTAPTLADVPEDFL